MLPAILPADMLEPISTAEIQLDSLPPKTPAAETILSPPSTEVLSSRPESKDTPPPGNLNLGIQPDTTGRPSRRARPQVSYKEPSLATKMRRPSKDLVDAVISNLDRRTSVEPPATAPNSAHVEAKEEPGGSSWKPLGVATGTREVDGTEPGSPLRQKLDRREQTIETRPEPNRKLNSAAAERAIEKMIEETSRGKRKSLTSLSSQTSVEDPRVQDRNDMESRAQQEEKETDMAVFEFTSSSPVTNAPATKTDTRPKLSLAGAVRERRRHSSVPATMSIDEKRLEASTGRQEGGLPSVHKRTMSGTTRTAPVAGLAKSTATARERMREREKRSGALPSSGSATDLRTKGEGSEAREGRAASRRKSMMV